jgi:hypothetical protein
MWMRLMWVLWPSFVVGGVGWAIFFALFDPADLPGADWFGESRMVIYSVGFFVFWLFAAASSAFTTFLQRPAADINRFCPLEADERPMGCPKREDPDATC